MSDITTTRIFSDGEKGITAAKMNDIIGSASIQTAFVSSKPVASSTVAGDNLLLLTSGGSYAKIDSSTFSSSIAALWPAPEPKIWAVRLRSFNAVGNPTFEVDQRTVGTGIGYGVGTTFCMDRWQASKAGATGTATAVQTLGTTSVPGTSFAIGGWFLRTTVTATQATLAAGDILWLNQNIEGPPLRELINDVHSVSILCRSSVANLKFGLALRDGPTTRSLVKLCSLGAANTWTLITLPNIPIWAAGGGWTFASGQAGYQLSITLACGTTYTAAANDTWQNANVVGAVGQSNFLANAGATFDLAYVGHESGAQCSTPMDCPFTQNYDDCLRYFQKSYDYGTALGTVTASGAQIIPQLSTAGLYGVRFFKPMAKAPTGVAIYNHANGATNTFQHTNGSNYTVSSANAVGQTGWLSTSTVTLPAVVAGAGGYVHWIADTGW